MFDFALSQSGDLIFIEKQNTRPLFKLSFTTAKTLKLIFDVSDFDPISNNSNGIKISLNVKDLDNNKRAMILYDTNAKTQLLRIKLNTALGELPQRLDIGSKLDLVRHKPLYDPKTLSLAQSYIKEAIVDLFPNAEVRVTASVDKTNGYAQQLNIYIFDNDLLIFRYSLKG